MRLRAKTLRLLAALTLAASPVVPACDPIPPSTTPDTSAPARDTGIGVDTDTRTVDAATGTADAGASADGSTAQPATDTADWPMALHDALASGYNPSERVLKRESVGQLEVKWRFDATLAGHEVGPIHATPVVAADHVYVGSFDGHFYAIDEQGKLAWEYVTRQASPALASLKATPVGANFVRDSASIVGAAVLPASRPYVIFGDLEGNLYALDRQTGAEVWVREDVDGHGLSGVFGNSLLLAGDTVIVGFASVEAMALNFLADSGYECCSFRGLVAAFDVATGAEKWRFFTVPAAERLPSERAPYLRGPSGASIWGQPSYDEETNTVYVGTGSNYSPTISGAATELTDSIIALDATSGALKWSYQATKNDIWSEGEFNPKSGDAYLDADFGDSPKIYQFPGVGKVVSAGQKNGAYHVLDAHTGRLVKRTEHLKMFNTLGGFQNLGAYANGIVYGHGTDRLGDPSALGEPFNGSLLALSPDGERVIWRFDIPFSPLIGGVAVANDVVYIVSPFEELLPVFSPPEWAFYALDAATGEVLTRMVFPERAIPSPVVSRGRIYVTEGNVAFTVLDLILDTTGSVLCLGLPGS